MEKLLRLVVLLVCFPLSSVAFGLEETHTYGTKTSDEPLSFSDWNYVTHGVLQGGAASQVAGSEYSNYRAAEAKKEAKRQCKVAAVSQLQNCIRDKESLHRRDSAWCSGAKWVGGAIGLAGGLAYYEGEGAGAVLLGGAGLVVYQMGDDCQTDVDRVFNVNLASCSANKDLQDIKCDAIK